MAGIVRSLAGILALSLLSPSCLRVAWSRGRAQRPIPAEEHADLAAGSSDLAVCLQRFGAPLFVWEERLDDTVLAWGWNESFGWGVNVSIPLAQQFSATLDFEDDNLDLPGLVLVFDMERNLIEKRVGLLSAIAPGAMRRRPSPVEEESHGSD